VCTLRLVREPFAGWALSGSCGEALFFGVNEVLRPERMPTNACEDFTAQALRAFGPRGPRRLTKELEEAFDGFGGLGRRPGPQQQGTF
jgi:hypothetical protein